MEVGVFTACSGDSVPRCTASCGFQVQSFPTTPTRQGVRGRGLGVSGNCGMMVTCLFPSLHFRLQRLKFKTLFKLHLWIPPAPQELLRNTALWGGSAGSKELHSGREVALTLDLLNYIKTVHFSQESGIYRRRALYCFNLKIIAVVLLKVIISFKYSDQVYFINDIYNYLQCLM